MRRSTRPSRRWLSCILVVALMGPTRAAVAGDEEARAEALEREGRFAEAAEVWERVIGAAPDAQGRMLASMHAVNAWLDAFAATGDAAYRCAARSVLTRALADEGIDERGREEFKATLAAIEAEGIACPARVELLDPEAPPRRAAPPVPNLDRAAAPVDVAPERTRGRQLTIAGASTLALAAPALGGLFYALAADQALIREARPLASDDPRLDELKQEAIVVRRMAIGLGTTAAALVGVGVGLVIAGRRLSVLPHARADLAGVAVVGRF